MKTYALFHKPTKKFLSKDYGKPGWRADFCSPKSKTRLPDLKASPELAKERIKTYCQFIKTWYPEAVDQFKTKDWLIVEVDVSFEVPKV